MDIKSIDGFISEKLKRSKLGRKKLLWLVIGIIIIVIGVCTEFFVMIANYILENFQILPDQQFFTKLLRPEFGLIFFAVTAIIGLLCIVYSYVVSQHQKKVKKVTSLIETYRRITLKNLSEKSGYKQSELIDLIALIGEMGILVGHFDRETDEFITDKAIQDQIEIKTCPNCGASLDKIYMRGEKITCNHCGSNI